MKCKLLAAVLALLPFAVPGAAMAQRSSNVTGANLLGFCNDRAFNRMQNCEAYLNGVADTFTGFLEFGPKDVQGHPLGALICIPRPVTGRDLRLLVIHGLQQQPALQSRPAVSAVYHILRQNYPCH